MQSPEAENFSLDYICRHLLKDEAGIWHSQQSSQCHYPPDGVERLSCIEEDSFWFRHRRNCIIEMVKRFAPDNFILDVGGGNGFITVGLKTSGFDAVLLEPNEEAIAKARQRGIDRIICSTVDNANFEPKSIPAIGAFDVLEHIENDLCFLKQLKHILISGGRLYLTVPAFGSLWSHEDRYAEHFRRYRRDLLCSQLYDCGFVVDYSSYFFSYLILPIFMFKTVPTRLGMAKTYTHEQTKNEHVIKRGWKKKVLNQVNTWEENRIATGKTMPCGTSLMIAAHVK